MDKIKEYSIGCDIGGSHLSCAVIDIVSGEIVKKSLVSVKVENSAESKIILQAWTSAINKCKENLPESSQFVGVGLAIPGPFDYELGIGLYDNSNQKFVHLKNVNVKSELAERLDMDLSCIRFINDASAFSLGSFWYGSGKGSEKMVAITLGTGFGSSFINKGQVVEEGNTVPEGGYLWDKSFKEGIADDYFSTRWFVNSFNEISEEQVTGVKPIADLANEGDDKAIEIFKVFGENLADCLGEHLKSFEAEVVVMGGNITEAFNLFEMSLQKKITMKNINIPFKVSILKENAAMLGAATLFK